jgi:hypothetical protein
MVLLHLDLPSIVCTMIHLEASLMWWRLRLADAARALSTQLARV